MISTPDLRVLEIIIVLYETMSTPYNHPAKGELYGVNPLRPSNKLFPPRHLYSNKRESLCMFCQARLGAARRSRSFRRRGSLLEKPRRAVQFLRGLSLRQPDSRNPRRKIPYPRERRRF